MRTRSANPYASPGGQYGLPSTATRTLRWQVAPATLSISLGVILFLMNCIHLHDAMFPEIHRSIESGNGHSFAHGLLCMIASIMFFGASASAMLAASFWMRTRYRQAVTLNVLAVPALLFLGVFFMYFQT